MADQLPGNDNTNLDSLLTKEPIRSSYSDKEIIEYIVDKFEPVKEQLRPLKTKFVKYNELYEMVQEERNYDGMANLFVPEILRSVETLVSLVHFGVFDNPKFLRFVGTEKSDRVSADNLTNLFYHQIQENNFKLVTSSLIRQMLIFGTGVRKVLWDFEQVKTKTRKRTGESVSSATELETVKDCWSFEWVDLLNFYIPPETPWWDVQKADWIAEEYDVGASWLRNKAKKNWIDKDEVKHILKESAPGSSSEENFKDQRLRSADINPVDKKQKYTVLEWYGLCPAKFLKEKDEDLDDDDLVKVVCIIVNGETIVKFDQILDIFWHNSYPYVLCPFIPREGSIFGMGVAEISESLQEELNDTRNQTMDNKTAILMNMWLKDRNANIADEDLILAPNRVIKTNDMNGLKPFAPPLFVGVGSNIESVIKEDIRQSVSAMSGLQGTPQPGVGSATEFQGIQNAGLSRSKLIINIFGECVLRPLARFVKFLDYQFFDIKKLIRVIGQNGIKHQFLSPDQIVGEYDVELELSTDFDKNPNVTKQLLINWLAMIKDFTPEQIKMHWPLLNEISKYFNIKNFDEWYPGAATADQEVLLTPQEELQVMLHRQPVCAKPGDDHFAHVQQHMKDDQELGLGLPPFVSMLNKAHIAEHWQFIKEIQERAQQQLVAAQASGAFDGQNANASASTLQQPGTDNELQKGLENI